MALARITWDLKSLQESPLPGIAAAPLDNDLWTWHFNLCGASGELQGLCVHGILKLGALYPSQPPTIRLCTDLPHPNVIQAAEGFSVCMDMLDASSTAPYSGWSSSYGVASILMQLQSVLFDERAAVFDRLTLDHAIRRASMYACPCGHTPGCTKPGFPTQADFVAAAGRKVVTRPSLPALMRADPSARCTTPPARIVPESCKPIDSQDHSALGDEEHWQQACSRRTLRQKKKVQEDTAQSSGAKAAAVALPAQGSALKDWGIRSRKDPTELTLAQQRNSRRAQQRAEKRRMAACVSASKPISPGITEATVHEDALDDRASTAASSHEADSVVSTMLPPSGVALCRVPHRLLIEVLAGLAPEDAVRFALCARFFVSLGEDGVLWRHLFSMRYPSSALTAKSIYDWKHCFLLEVNHIEADLVCFHTKVSFHSDVLGIPLDFSVNPRTQRVDYISTTLDLISAAAFDSGLRRSQWNESFKEWLPLYFTAEHFLRAQRRFEKSILHLSPHWRTCRFNPFMILEALPKLMNTMIVLLCDKGLEASDRALDGYFLLWRLLRGAVEAYGLQSEVERRLKDFLSPSNRTKDRLPSMGDFLPLLSVQRSPSSAWATLAQPVLEETFDRNVLWVCRDRPDFARPANNVLGQGADMDRLSATLQSSRVSKRLLMFHVRFLELVSRQSADLFFGMPPQHLRQEFKQAVRGILSVDQWPAFFAACRRPCPGPARLTDILKQATRNSLRKRYHTENTDFSSIQRSGVSHILQKGESYKVAGSVTKVRLTLGSDSAMILCGACLVYEDLTCAAVVSYDSREGYRGAVRHSGDTIEDGNSKHVMDVDLSALPASVTRLFFTLCACGCADLSGFKSPAIDMRESGGSPLCTYSIDKAGRAPTVVMAGVVRRGGSWEVTALGVPSAVRCCGNYNQVKRDIAAIRL
mmetsp:Transcript_64770/g.163045  ORF Transcript_64770/g.163045 Transcript_64770/m.163045 type:complete len:928 (+) Transcript_64770:100-2883(+)